MAKSCKIGLALKFTFKVITAKLSPQMNQFLWQVIDKSCGICIIGMKLPFSTGKALYSSGPAFSGTPSTCILLVVQCLKISACTLDCFISLKSKYTVIYLKLLPILGYILFLFFILSLRFVNADFARELVTLPKEAR